MARPKMPAAPLASAQEIEQQFYEALQRGDIELLMSVWSDDDDVVCVHPGGPRVVGPAAIRASFDAIFTHGAIDVQPEQVRRVHSHACAVHSVLERIRVVTGEGPHEAWVVATNVYLKSTQGWRLVAHHSSIGSPQEAQQSAEATSVLH